MPYIPDWTEDQITADYLNSVPVEEIMNPELDQVTCARCGFQFYKEDCARTTAGGWLCENCADKLTGGEDGGE